MNPLPLALLERLIEPGPRLPWIVDWLQSEVWSEKRFSALSAEEYLLQGEKLVHEAEELLAKAAYQFYDELAAAAADAKTLAPLLTGKTAVVIFDGASLREAPIFLNKAKESGFRAVEQGISFAALPSDTVDFVDQRLLGKRVPPKLLPQRQELKDRKVKACYFADAISSQTVECAEGQGVLLWSAFPDVTYRDSEARFARHFAGMPSLYDAAWKNTVMQVPRGRRVLVTSDHGYIFLGAGFDSTRPDGACALLEQKRNKIFSEEETLPNPETEKDLQVFPDRRLAMLRGRLKNRPQGPSANRIYRHGGLSLMEMLVPWIVFERE